MWLIFVTPDVYFSCVTGIAVWLKAYRETVFGLNLDDMQMKL
jgi:hypothetical protein